MNRNTIEFSYGTDSINQERSKEVIAGMVFHRSEAVNSLLASMPVQVIVNKKSKQKAQAFAKLLIVKRNDSLRKVMLMMNRSLR